MVRSMAPRVDAGNKAGDDPMQRVFHAQHRKNRDDQLDH
jgi:hypothetical protein